MRNKEMQILQFSDKLKALGVLEQPSIKYISKKLGMSQKKTTSRIKDMYNLGFGNLTVSLNYKKLPLLMAEISIKSVHPSENDYILDYLRKTKYVEDIVQVSGQVLTHQVSVKVSSLEELNKVSYNILNGLSNKYAKTTTMIIHDYIWGDETFFPDVKSEKVELDKIDWKIISLLKEDAMMPLRKMSEKTGLREPTIHRRIKLLREKEVIRGYICKRKWINIPKEMRPISSLFFIRLPAGSREERKLISELLESENSRIYFAFSYFGDWNILMGVKSKSVIELDNFIDRGIAKNEKVVDIKTYTILETHTRNVYADFAE